MSKFKKFIGIDVSKGWLDFASRNEDQETFFTFRVANTASGIGKAIKIIRKKFQVQLEDTLFCLEHTGVYGFPFLKYAGDNQLNTWLESGWKIQQSHPTRGKSDKEDSMRIAEYAERFRDRIRLWNPEPDHLKQLRELMAVRDRIIKVATQIKVPIGESKALKDSVAEKIAEKASNPILKTIKLQLKKVENEIDGLIQKNADMKINLELIISVKGIGRQTALALILYTRNFTLITDAKALACYCGVAPFENSSGSSKKGSARVSNYANKTLKRLLHMAACAAIRSNQELRFYYKRKVQEGKSKMLVMNAVRNKLLHCIVAIIKRGSPYIDKFSKTKENLVAVS